MLLRSDLYVFKTGISWFSQDILLVELLSNFSFIPYIGTYSNSCNMFDAFNLRKIDTRSRENIIEYVFIVFFLIRHSRDPKKASGRLHELSLILLF